MRVSHSYLLARASLLACVAAATCPSLALAQSRAQSQAESQPQSVSDTETAEVPQDIVVTGSRIARRDYTASSPIVSVSAETLVQNASVELEGKLNKLPQFLPGRTAFDASFSSPGIATLNLRGLGASRNLVLLDGRRLQPATAAVEIDINAIPSILIGNVEIITGGASAVYGSDAVSGVVNFQTRKNLTGVILQGSQGVNEAGDGRTTNLSIATGTKFADGRGSVMAALEYYERNVVYRRNRSFYTDGFAGGGGVSSNVTPLGTLVADTTNLPSAAAISSVFAKYGYGGTYSPTAAYGFNPDGTLFKGSGGIVNYRGPGSDQGYGATSSGSLYYNPDYEQIMQSPLRRYSAFAKADYELSDAITVYAQGLFSETKTTVNGSGALGISPFNPVISINNPFIPDDLRTILASRANPTANFGITKRFSDILGPRMTSNDVTQYQIMAGLKGTIPGSSVTWDLYGSHGKTTLDQEVYSGAYSVAALNTLLQSSDGGASLCEGGFNIFALADVSQSCRDYISRTIFNTTTLKQDVAELNLQGKVLDLPAGELRFAAGAGYRRNFYETIPDEAIRTNPPLVNALTTTAPTRGSTTVKEVYGELLVPLLRDLPAVEALELDVAARYSDYNVSGSVWTYKGDLRWTVGGGVTLRGGYQRAVRAPNVGELFLGQQAGGTGTTLGSPTAGGGDPCDVRSTYRRGDTAGQVRSLCLATGVPESAIDSYVLEYNQIPAVAEGNTRLKPEKADTITLGGTWRSTFAHPLLSGLQISVDYYRIKLKDAIGVVGASTTLYNCFNANNSNPTYSSDNVYCGLVTRNPDGSIYQVSQAFLNLGGYKIAGIDGQIDWTLALADFGVPGSGRVHVGSVISYQDTFKIQNLPGTAYQEYAGTVRGPVGTLPRWKYTSTLDYSDDTFNVGLRWRHINAMKDQSAVTTPANVLPGARSYDNFDLFGGFKVGTAYSLSFGVDNLTNRKPVVLTGVAGVTDTGTYDPLGRRYYVNLTTKF